MQDNQILYSKQNLPLHILQKFVKPDICRKNFNIIKFSQICYKQQYFMLKSTSIN